MLIDYLNLNTDFVPENQVKCLLLSTLAASEIKAEITDF